MTLIGINNAKLVKRDSGIIWALKPSVHSVAQLLIQSCIAFRLPVSGELLKSGK